MDEFGLIGAFFRDGWPDSDALVTGIGDDAAVMSVTPNHELVTSVDALVEGVHFPPSMDAADLGFRLVAVNISDFAAMGADPRWMALSLSMPTAEERWLQDLADGMRDAAGQHGLVLVGGDTTRAPVRFLSLQLIGEVPAGQAILRSGARPGDGIYVTGHPGMAAAGLETLLRGEAIDALYRAFARPASRVAAGRRLRGAATAAIDISDGLYGDLAKLLAASGSGGTLEIDRLPLSDALLDYVETDEAIAFALSGGDDYELLFTAPSPPADLDCPLTRIGTVTEGSGIRCTRRGEVFAFDDRGYRHFE